MQDTMKIPRVTAAPTVPIPLDPPETRDCGDMPGTAAGRTSESRPEAAQYPLIHPDQVTVPLQWQAPSQPQWHTMQHPAPHTHPWTHPQIHSPAPSHPAGRRNGPRPRRRNGVRWTMSLLLFLILALATLPILIYLSLTVQSMTGLGTPLTPLDDGITASVLILGAVVAVGIGFLPGFVSVTLGTRSPGWGAVHGLWTSPLLVLTGLLLSAIVLLR